MKKTIKIILLIYLYFNCAGSQQKINRTLQIYFNSQIDVYGEATLNYDKVKKGHKVGKEIALKRDYSYSDKNEILYVKIDIRGGQAFTMEPIFQTAETEYINYMYGRYFDYYDKISELEVSKKTISYKIWDREMVIPFLIVWFKPEKEGKYQDSISIKVWSESGEVIYERDISLIGEGI